MLAGSAHANIQAEATEEQEQGETVGPLHGGRLWDPRSNFKVETLLIYLPTIPNLDAFDEQPRPSKIMTGDMTA